MLKISILFKKFHISRRYFISKRGRKLFSVKRNLLIQGNIYESKNQKYQNSLNLLVEFNIQKHNLKYKCHIYKIKTMI